MREKEKLLVMSNFSYTLHVFIRLVLQTRKNQGLFGKGLTLSKTNPCFYVSAVWESFKNIVGKEETAHDEQFLLFPLCELPSWRTFCHFHQT